MASVRRGQLHLAFVYEAATSQPQVGAVSQIAICGCHNPPNWISASR
jgi:hypothetical protein